MEIKPILLLLYFKSTIYYNDSIINKSITARFAFISINIFLLFSLFIFHISNVYAPLDSFSARGIIFIPIPSDDIDTETVPSSTSANLPSKSVHTTTTENNNNTIVPNINTTKEREQNISVIQTIKGNWILKINKGSPEVFNTLLVSSDKNGIPKNAYGIYNLRDVKFIQLDNRGNDIINGKVDFRSVGQVNKTITDIDATLIFERLQNIQIILNNDTISTNYFFNQPITGKIILMADAIGNVLVDKRPKTSAAVPSPNSPSSNAPAPSDIRPPIDLPNIKR
jgi:hypothetical protein